MEIVKLSSLSFAYENSRENVLDNIDLEIKKGEFMIIYGPSGCGKTTLLKLMKKELMPKGKLTGGIFYKDREISSLSSRESAVEIGFVMQDPDSQIVTDSVWHELAFGLESLGLPREEIRRKTAEISSFFGMNSWYRSKTSELSGGQKQILNLASVMVMSPELILLDEPVSQLDPFAARTFLSMLERINRELGVTVVMAEHNLENVFSHSDRITVMDMGKIRYTGLPSTCGKVLADNAKILKGLPLYVQLHSVLKLRTPCPSNIIEAGQFLQSSFGNRIDSIQEKEKEHDDEKAVELKNIRFRYEREGEDILRDVNMTVKRGEIYCVVGGNGSGKTTLLSVIAGLNHPIEGKARVYGKKAGSRYDMLSYLPQNPVTVFTGETVGEDLMTYARKTLRLDDEVAEDRVQSVGRELGILGLMQKHPYDLSGGECQKAAITKIMLKKPELILLDEPTKGIDAWAKQRLAAVIKDAAAGGRAVIMVTHDLEFAAEVSDRCGLLFDGEIISESSSREFFSSSEFYTTAARRMTRGFYKNAVTGNDIIYLCHRNGGVQ